RAFDPERGAAAAQALGASGAFADLIRGAAGSSPYLSDLIRREAEWLAAASEAAPDDALKTLLTGEEVAAADGLRAVGVALRVLKRRAALLIALADLGGVWTLEGTTRALSAFADRAVALAFDHALGAETSGPLVGRSAAEAGLIVLAMGKGGAEELNYSSDVDLVLLYDDERGGDPIDLKPAWTRVARRAVKLLSETTAEGYVLRTDLRLRPNPSVTPIVLPVDAAERYYESMGRTWERAAFIKARPAAGDLEAGAGFLDGIAPFVWRRHLDFAALEDINEIRAKIRDAKGLGGLRDLPGYDLKLGPGGIREVEFFAQTQQLAFGGRDPALRSRRTVGALAALAAAGKIEAEAAEALTAAYREHRRLEHLLQMVGDAQTHQIPVRPEAREEVAALGGWTDAAAMEAETAARLSEVRARVKNFFGRSGGGAPARALDETLTALPYERPDRAREMVERWMAGGVAATRGDRARDKLRRLAPLILEKLATSRDPDEAALHFDRFISGLPAGAQLFSLFEANPQLLDLLAEICAAAPRLAEYLGRNAGVLDAVLDADFFAPPPPLDALCADLGEALAEADDYETVLDRVRAWAKDQRFRLGVQVLRGVADEIEAGRG
ncbi:MAG: glutamine-synthetase adenylyltransferase, partial [Pseudomonadota bacterium]